MWSCIPQPQMPGCRLWLAWLAPPAWQAPSHPRTCRKQVWNVAFLFTIFLGVEIGIIVSVCVSLLLVIYKNAFPRITTLGKLPGTEVYRCVLCWVCVGREGRGSVCMVVARVLRSAGLLLPTACRASCRLPRRSPLMPCPAHFPKHSPLSPLPPPCPRSTKMYPNAELQSGMLMMRVDGEPGSRDVPCPSCTLMRSANVACTLLACYWLPPDAPSCLLRPSCPAAPMIFCNIEASASSAAAGIHTRQPSAPRRPRPAAASPCAALALPRLPSPCHACLLRPHPPPPQSIKEFVRDKVIASRRRREEMGDHIRFVVIDMSPVTDIDSSAMHFLGGWVAGAGCVVGWGVVGCRGCAGGRGGGLQGVAHPVAARPMAHPVPAHLPCPSAADDFIDELAQDGIELVLANPSQQVRPCCLAAHPAGRAQRLAEAGMCGARRRQRSDVVRLAVCSNTRHTPTHTKFPSASRLPPGPSSLLTHPPPSSPPPCRPCCSSSAPS